MRQSSVVCETCGKVYSKKYGLLRHINTAHEQRVYFGCEICDKRFPRKDMLKRHILKAHTEKPPKPLVKCEFCDKGFKSIGALKSHIRGHQLRTEPLMKKNRKKKGAFECNDCANVFVYRQNLVRHIQNVHMSPQLFECTECGLIYKSKYSYMDHFRVVHESNENLTCSNCGRCFCSERSLKKHLTNCANIQRAGKTATSIICVECEMPFPRLYLLLKHYTEEHDITLNYESKQFDTMEEFYKWKQEVEFFTISGYHASSGTHDTANGRLRKFRCHRSGVYKSQCEDSKRVRRLKRKGSKKLQGLCPAEITVKERKSDGKCEVIFQSTHVGHEIGTQAELSHIYMDKMKRLELAAKIADRVPLTVIMENENESLINGNHDNRKRTITTKDLHNIKLRYVPDVKPQERRPEDVTTFVEQNRDSILYFKNSDGEEVSVTTLKKSITFSFETEDFVLIFMNAEQKKTLQLMAENRVVYIEGTCVLSNPEKYNLHTVTVLNLNQEGLPVAFLLTTRDDETVITCFLECIKVQVGELRIKTLISDMQPIYFESWAKVMPLPQYYLHCAWHVTQEWDRLCKKISVQKRDHFRSTLDKLHKELDENKFRIMLEDFVSQTDPDNQKFLENFKVNYMNNAEQWAFCYRMYAEIDTNADLHFKCNAVEGKKIKTVAWCLESLKNFLSFIYREEEMKKINGYTPSKLKLLNARHIAALEQMNDFTIYQLDESNKWQVISSENIYTVCKQQPQCLSDCLLKCAECNHVCLHEYTCSCMDHSVMYNMCEHIHAVLMICSIERSEEMFAETFATVTAPSDVISSDPLSLDHFDETYTTEHELSKAEILAEVKQKFSMIEQNIENLSSNMSHWISIKEILDAIPAKIMDISMNASQENDSLHSSSENTHVFGQCSKIDFENGHTQ